MQKKTTKKKLDLKLQIQLSFHVTKEGGRERLDTSKNGVCGINSLYLDKIEYLCRFRK